MHFRQRNIRLGRHRAVHDQNYGSAAGVELGEDADPEYLLDMTRLVVGL
jgi:hypothetical protein